MSDTLPKTPGHAAPQPAALARWWREPRWARVSLVVILVGTAVGLSWNLARGGDFSFYEASARSMSGSWHALLFGAFDPDATVTLDKLSWFAIPQALSIDLFGMSTSSVALPQVIEGLITVWACAVIGLRWAGRSAGLVAAAAAATTPIFLSMFAHPMEDGLVTMALAVALLWWQRAILTGRWWPLLLAGLFVGIGFQAKMMQAWFILPALVIGTLVASPEPARRVVARTGALVGVAVAASLAWITAIQLTPAADRPYIDGSTDNNVFAMVFGYNGIGRFIPSAVPGAVGYHASGGGEHVTTTAASSTAHLASTLPAAAAPEGPAPQTVFKLLEPLYGSQVGWLYPVAIAGVVLGVRRWWPAAVRRRAAPAAAADPGAAAGTGDGPRPNRAIRADRTGWAMLLVLVIWLLTAAAVLTAARVPHTAYVAAIGVQLVLLAAVGLAEAVRLLRSPRLAARLVLTGLLVVQTAWSGWLAVGSGTPWVLIGAMAALAVTGIVVAALAAVRSWFVPTAAESAPESAPGSAPDPAPDSAPAARRGWARAVPVVAAVALLAGPACFSVQVLDAYRDGSGSDASVGTRGTTGSNVGFAVSAPDIWGGRETMLPAVAQLRDRARAAGGGQDGAPLFVSDWWAISASIIDATGDSVLTDGGYSGQVPVFTTADLDAMVASGRNRLFVVKDGAPAGDPVQQTVHHDGCIALQSWTASADAKHTDLDTGFTLYRCSPTTA
ncbi:ArnT family glycosyltransferase [Nakamurella sp.]|uniref:ArnT family glycosyltransferase n=1 Tax=Nakamurella sp. TaxID=1869182 RepID=UPI003B3B1A83